MLHLFSERGVLVDVSHLVAADVSGCVGADGAAVLSDVSVAAPVVLRQLVVIATVVLGADRVALEHGVEFGGALECRQAVTSSGGTTFTTFDSLMETFHVVFILIYKDSNRQ